MVRVLEAQIIRPYEGFMGLGFANVPGLPRLESCAFTGEFPLSRIDFHDPELPVHVSLEVADGELGPEGAVRGTVGSLCLQREVGPRSEAEYTFLLSWLFPNRTAERCGWTAPKGHERDVIGNYYSTRFTDAWKAAEYAAAKLPRLEVRIRKFVEAMRLTTVPDAVRDAAMSNLSTLVTPTTF
jgi:hypothetical protein